MAAFDTAHIPEFKDWNIAAVRLLQGVVYSDETEVWNITLSSQSTLEPFFARLGLLLVIDEPEGFAFLRQMLEDEQPAGYERLPRLFRRSRLSYDATLLCVLLRDELRRFEDEDLQNERCVTSTSELFEQWKLFFAGPLDEVRLRKGLDSALRTLEELKFIRRLSVDAEEWELRRILKARLPASELERLRIQLVAAAQRRAGSQSGDESSD